MKKITLLLFLLLISLCTLAQKNVVLKIYKKLGANTFALNQASQNDISQNFKITRMDYYLSGFTIIHDGGMQTVVPASTRILVKGNANVNQSLGSFNVTKVEGIKFHIGVENPINNGDPAIWAVPNPLAPQSPSMHWGWSAGYRFVALEGKSGTTFVTTFEMHGLGNANYFETTVMAPGINSGNDATLNIDADYNLALKTINVNAGAIDHGVDATDLTVLQNFRDFVFKPNPAFLANTNFNINQAINIYPNPSNNNIVNLIISDSSINFTSAVVVDVTGKTIDTFSLVNKTKLEMNLKTKGFYIIKFYSESNNVANHKLLIN